jgi:hypothetical protein
MQEDLCLNSKVKFKNFIEARKKNLDKNIFLYKSLISFILLLDFHSTKIDTLLKKN